MSKPSKGPWKAVGKGDMHDGGSSVLHPCFRGSIVAADGHRIIAFGCFLGITGATPEEAEANAKLIAAASDLFKACSLALSFCYGSTNDNPEKYLERAIAKAEGRG